VPFSIRDIVFGNNTYRDVGFFARALIKTFVLDNDTSFRCSSNIGRTSSCSTILDDLREISVITRVKGVALKVTSSGIGRAAVECIVRADTLRWGTDRSCCGDLTNIVGWASLLDGQDLLAGTSVLRILLVVADIRECRAAGVAGLCACTGVEWAYVRSGLLDAG
jgi:hypothetical protein